MVRRLPVAGSVLVALMVCLAGPGRADAQDETPSLAGSWLGVVQGGKVPLFFVLTISQDGKDKLTGRLASPAEGVFGLPMQNIGVKDGTVKFFVPDATAKYEGKLDAQGTKIIGTWSKVVSLLPFSTVTRPVAFMRLNPSDVPDLSRPQEPKKPYPYVEEEVVFANPKAKIKLAAALSKPKGPGPFPAAIMISGSGPQDRDGTGMYGHKPYWVLADHLTRQGIAVLRFDERGVGKSGGAFFGATSDDFASDVLAGVNYLKSRQDIHPGKIGLVGHSEGGVIAPLVASQSDDVAFTVLLAGPAVPGDRLTLLQDQRILRGMGYSETAVALCLMQTMHIIQVLQEEKNDARAEKPITEGLEILNKELLRFGIGPTSFPRETYAWQRFFLGYDPRPVLERVACPVLALFGETDLLVPAKENQAEMEQALRRGRTKDFTIKVIPQANHLFQTSNTGLPADHSLIPETMNPAVMETVSEWILSKAGR
jgi:pimeloyl-ACP methyl ester carboxylesterase